MKATGIVRKVDDLGRIVLPMELRRTLGIEVKDAVEVFMDGDSVVLRKYVPGCVFCSSMDTAGEVCGKPICKACAAKARGWQSEDN